MDVFGAYRMAWRLKLPLLLAHLATLALFAGLLVPAVSVALQMALALSGRPALTDKDIALFLLSPGGAIAMLAVGALFLSVQVVGFAVKMAVLSSASDGKTPKLAAALARVARMAPRVLRLALGFVLRVLGLTLPFLAAAGVVAFVLLGDYDINYYLTARPPSFLVAAGLIAGILIALLVLLVPRLMAWALALPLVLFGNVPPRDAFRESAGRMSGRRIALARRLALWAGAALALGALAATIAGFAGRAAAALAGDDLGQLAPLLLGAAGLLALLNILVATLSSGALACLLLAEAGWPDDAAAQRAAAPGRRRAQLLAAGLAAVAGLGLLAGGMTAPPIAAPGDIVVIAHRGGAAAQPENTMAAMEQGIAEGADWLEIDVQESAEGEVIVFHDSDFMKIAGDPIKVWDVTSSDLDRLDVGAWFSPDHAGARVPRLSEVLEAARGRSMVLIELKYYGHQVALEERVAAEVEAAGMVREVAAMSLSPEGAARMKAIRPGWQVGLLAATALGPVDRLEADFLAVNAAMATPRLLRRAAAADKPVYVWTVNDAGSMARMAALGVSGLITDRPALARSVLEEMAALSAPERLVLSLADRLGIAGDAPEMRDAEP